MNRIKTILVDDEPLARKGLSLRLGAFDQIDLVAECGNGLDALDAIKEHEPDLVFLDIQMPELNGFDILKRLEDLDIPLPLVIFVTAFDHYALKAFEVHALDYLLKPLDEERLAEAMVKVEGYIDQQEDAKHKANLVRLMSEVTGTNSDEILKQLATGEPLKARRYSDVLAIKDGGEITRVPCRDISWIDAAGDYMCVHTKEQTHIMRKTMKELEAELDPNIFIRVHRSAMVNIHQVIKLYTHENGDYYIVLSNEKELKVSRSYRDRIKQAIK
ncbi:response regulator transcription factor [Catenovulum sp. SM1970]|uniref:LytR/AlgR family response regulator transcription factor n=1 Tax=Marinifaba aquimaris TaxID=2741323 RepID=UPI001574ECDA|nr:LytTR family DNA-binding domain-containing protein [Marinifaba aquimaris]NTS78166.1 response regulator transcription factor [Marinifaba aquimaris]